MGSVKIENSDFGFSVSGGEVFLNTLGWRAFSGGQAPPRLKPKPMYVVFNVEFNGIVRNIHFRRDITMKNFKNHGTIFLSKFTATQRA